MGGGTLRLWEGGGELRGDIGGGGGGGGGATVKTKHFTTSPRLYVTYFGGDEKLGLEPDNEARDYWLALGLAANRVIPFDCKGTLPCH